MSVNQQSKFFFSECGKIMIIKRSGISIISTTFNAKPVGPLDFPLGKFWIQVSVCNLKPLITRIASNPFCFTCFPQCINICMLCTLHRSSLLLVDFRFLETCFSFLPSFLPFRACFSALSFFCFSTCFSRLTSALLVVSKSGSLFFLVLLFYQFR